MSSGTPVCPICQQEHNDSTKLFDTLTVCNKCNSSPGMDIPVEIIKKMYARFSVDALAFYYRKDILREYMENFKSKL